MAYVSSQISQNGNSIQITDAGNTFLADRHIWGMVLDDRGTIIWKKDVPNELDRTYNIMDVASFTRWYLDDYPVLVQTRDFGLIVLGYPSEEIMGVSFSKLYYVYDSRFAQNLIIGLIILIVINISFLFFLSWRNSQNLQKSIIPILDGVDKITRGEAARLKTNGDLKDVYERINHASDTISKDKDAKAAWINGISHDIRTPLSLIIGYSSEIEEDEMATEYIKKEASIISTQGNEIKRLVENLNLVSRLDYAIAPLKRSEIDINETIRQVVSALYNQNLSNRYEIIPEIEGSLSYYGDSELLYRMINNIIMNSIHHNKEGVCIRISTFEEENRKHIRITDNGAGMSKQQLLMYNQGKTEESTYEAGGITAHGVGMKIIFGIVKAHQGRIVFQNIKPSGLEVDIWL